jgi:hypothetical protein
MYAGGLTLLGGIRAQEMVLEDFLPIVKEYRKAWFPEGAKVMTCTSPMGEKTNMLGQRYTALDIVRQSIGPIVYRDNGNAHDVRLALIESLSGYLRRRTTTGDESIAVNDDLSHWLVASHEGIKESAFLHIALEAGYCWDKFFASGSNKEVTQPREDDTFAIVGHCVVNLRLNFCAGRQSQQEMERERAKMRERQTTQSTSPSDWTAM